MKLSLIDMSNSADRLRLIEVIEKLVESTSTTGEAAATVSSVIKAVGCEGDEAVVRFMRQWTDPAYSVDRIAVDAADIEGSVHRLYTQSPDLAAVIERSIANVRAYQRHILPKPTEDIQIAGATLGLRFSAVKSVGLVVPGGRASYPSSVIMLAVPAIEAGVRVDQISVATPPPTPRPGEDAKAETGPMAMRAGDISPLVMATCGMLGIKRIYRVGGAQAVAAMALGTKTIKKVDMVVGPGNVYSQLAKAQLAGRIGIDGFYGPSEIVTIADETARPDRVASDLIAQAEHDPGRCFLIAWSRKVIEKIDAEVSRQIADRKRVTAIEQSLKEWSTAILVRDEAEAIIVADSLAAEHVNLAVKDPDALVSKLRHGGEFFLGDSAPVAAGDYYAGPSHCLPTGTTARFASGISVYTFLKRSGTVAYPNGMPAQAAADVARFAEAEGLDGHAASARLRAE